MKKAISLVLALVLCLGLCSCGTKESSDLEKARSEAKNAQNAYDSISKAANDAQNRVNEAKGRFGK